MASLDRLADLPADVAKAAASACRELAQAERTHWLIGLSSAEGFACPPREVIEDQLQRVRAAELEAVASPDDPAARYHAESTRRFTIDALNELARNLRTTRHQVVRADVRRAITGRLNRYLQPVLRRTGRPQGAARRRRTHRASQRARSPGRKDTGDEPAPPEPGLPLARGGPA
jgi:hypothetical protein